MKPSEHILILMSLVSFPGTISGGGTTEERRRAATVSALRRQELPPQLLSLIASNGHVSRDCEQLEMGFFPQNEWKALKRVFRRNERTAAIHHVIDQYDDARGAAEDSLENDDRDWRSTVFMDQEKMLHASIKIRSGKGVRWSTEITWHEVHEITELFFPVLDGKDIGDISYLPPNLRSLVVSDGVLNNFEFSKLPKGLRWLTLPGPDAESKLHVQSLPPGLEEFRLGQSGSRRKEDPLNVHFNLPLPQGLTVRVLRMDGLVFHPEPVEIKRIDAGLKIWEKIWELKWDDGSQIYVVVHVQ